MMIENEKAACRKFFATVILIPCFISLLILLREALSIPREAIPLGFRETWYNSCNLIVAGDSRTQLAVDPDQLARSKNYKGVNFSFMGNALSEQYLDKITALLVRNGPRVIIFGITPHAFSPHALMYNGFLSYKSSTLGERIFSWFFGNKWNMLSTMGISEIRYIITGGKYYSPLEMVTSSNGWVAAYCRIPDDETIELKYCERNFQFGPVIPDATKHFFDKVREWTSKGIFIIGFRPPTTEKMVSLENRVSGFNESDFEKRFEQAGGYWIKVPQHGVYRCYDGSHITADAAQELSRYLSSEICTRVPQLQTTLCSYGNL